METARRLDPISHRSSVVTTTTARLPVFLRVVTTTAAMAGALAGAVDLALRHHRAPELLAQRLRIATALRRSKSRYQSLFLHAPYGIYVVTAAGRLLSANWALARILGYDSLGQVLALNARVFSQDPAAWESARAAWQDPWHQSPDLSWQRRDGQPIIVRLTGRALLDPVADGETFEVFVQDVTEERRLQGAMRQAQKLEAVGQLAAGLAHDFNNLLTSILGYSELALEQIGPDHQAHADIKEIHRAGQTATSLTRQLLTLTHKQSLKLAVVDLNAIVRASEPMIRRTLSEALVVVVRLAPLLDTVKGDAVDLEQALLNLCLNARDAMSTGGTLTIETANASAEDIRTPLPTVAVIPGRYVRLTVTDTGTGMDATTRRQIFEPFFTTKGAGRGTGLGLAMVHSMTRQLNGHVCVDSEPQVGSTFSLYLPSSDEVVLAGPALVYKVAPIGTETVLVIEDEQIVLTLIASVLARHGYRVLEATSPRDALVLMAHRTEPIDLILSDVVLPEMLGPTLVAKLRDQAVGTLRVIYMSGYASDALGCELGVSHEPFLPKPFTHTELLDTVRDILDTVSAA